MERKIGAQMYTVRDYIKTEADIEETINKLVKIGYKFGQSSAMGPIAPEKLKEICDKAGYAITGDHISWEILTEDLDKAIANHKVFGCTIFGVGGMPEFARESKEGLFKFIDEANVVADKMAAEGATFTYHNHAFEFSKFDGKTIMDYLLELTNDNFKLMVDTHWLAVAGINPVKFLRAHKDKVGGVHYKDLKVKSGENVPSIAEIGVGNLDWEEIAAVCDEINPPHIYVEQDTNWSPDPFASLEMSYKFLSKMGYR